MNVREKNHFYFFLLLHLLHLRSANQSTKPQLFTAILNTDNVTYTAFTLTSCKRDQRKHLTPKSLFLLLLFTLGLLLHIDELCLNVDSSYALQYPIVKYYSQIFYYSVYGNLLNYVTKYVYYYIISMYDICYIFT